MSGRLTLRFADNMPPASVEVVSPSLETVGRVALEAGGMTSLDVPSEGSFLRVHLPSGRVVTVEDPGSLDRTISPEMLDIVQQRTRYTDRSSARLDIQQFADQSAYMDEAPIALQQESLSSPPPGIDALPLGHDISVELPDGRIGDGYQSDDQKEIGCRIYDNAHMPASTVRVLASGEPMLSFALPGNVNSFFIRADHFSDSDMDAVSIRLTSNSPGADALITYLGRGDLASAASMTDWVGNAASMLQGKMGDPYSAAVGAYLLLRIRAFDRMRDWARNLAELFPFLPDGCVIWAWQLIEENPNDEAQIRDYLLKAADRGLPVYTEGLRLLMDGLRLLGPAGQDAHQKLLEESGTVLWDSPVTARLLSGTTSRPRRVVFDLTFTTGA